MHNGVLTDSEKKDRNLDASKLYVFKFLFNGNQNKAADPAPFKLANLDTLASKAIGRPFVVPKWGDKMHVRSQKDTVEDQLKVQARYSIGEIVDTTRSNSGNYYGIIEIWPEYEGMIRKNLIPDFTSPTVFVNSRDKTGQITDAEFLNIQAVPAPGYEPEYAGVNGVCDGTKDSCMNELRTLAAASKLSMVRQNNKSFSNMLTRIRGSMSMEAQQGEASNNDITKALEGLQGMVKGNTETLTMIGDKIKTHGEILVSLAENTEGVDIDDVREKLGGGESADEGDGEMMGAAGDEDEETDKKTKGKPKNSPVKRTSKDRQIMDWMNKYKTLSKDFDAFKKEREFEKAEIAKERRLNQAKTIVDHLISIKQISESEREKKLQYYNDLKDDHDTLMDLTLYANELKAIKPQVVAAAGNELVWRFPIPKTDDDDRNIDKLKGFGVY